MYKDAAVRVNNSFKKRLRLLPKYCIGTDTGTNLKLNYEASLVFLGGGETHSLSDLEALDRGRSRNRAKYTVGLYRRL